MENTKKDPVCGMNVDPSKTKFKAKFHNNDVCFCSKQCQDKFNKNPDQYSK